MYIYLVILAYVELELIFQVNQVNTVATDVLAHCVAMSSVTMVWVIQDKWVLGFHKEGLQQLASPVLGNGG